MNTIKVSLTILFIAMSTLLFAQKVNIKKDVITIDGETYGKIEDDKAVAGSFYINDNQDVNLLYFKWVVVDDLNYFEIYKADDYDNILFEELAVMGFKKYIVDKLYNAKALTTSGLDDEKLTILAKKMGKAFTRKREERLNNR